MSKVTLYHGSARVGAGEGRQVQIPAKSVPAQIRQLILYFSYNEE